MALVNQSEWLMKLPVALRSIHAGHSLLLAFLGVLRGRWTKTDVVDANYFRD